MEPRFVSSTGDTSKVMNEYQKNLDGTCGCSFSAAVQTEGLVGVLEAISNMKSNKEAKENSVHGDVSMDGCNEEGLAGRISLVERGIECDNGNKVFPIDNDKEQIAKRDTFQSGEPGRMSNVDAVKSRTELGVCTEGFIGKVTDGEGRNVPEGKSCSEIGNDQVIKVSSEDKDASKENCPKDRAVANSCAEDVIITKDYGMDKTDFKGKKRKVEEVEKGDGKGETGNRVESEEESDVGQKEEERWRKRRKRKSKRKAPSISFSGNRSSSSGDELEPKPETEGKQGRGKRQDSAAEDEQQFCLRWNNFLTNITSQFGTLRDDEDFVDVTLACGGMQVKAHRVVLSACSPYFKRMFKSVPYCQHPVVFLEGIQPSHLLSLLAFMYCGEVGVRRGQLPSLLSTAHALQIRGLTDMGNPNNSGDEEDNIILSAKKQVSAVERALKDIGLCDLQKGDNVDEYASGTPSPEKLNRKDIGSPPPFVSRDRPNKQSTGGGSSHLEGEEGKEELKEENVMRSQERLNNEEESSIVKQDGVVRSKQDLSPVAVKNVAEEMSSLRGLRKNHQSSFVLENGPTIDELSSRVANAQSPVSESTMLCDMAASLVDVRIGSPHSERGIICVDGVAVLPHVSSQGERDGNSLSQHEWDPGEEHSSQFEPRIDLVTDDFTLLKPKEENESFTEIDVDEMPLSQVIEPKIEFQDFSSADGEVSRSCSIQVLGDPSASSPSPHHHHHHKYRHALGSPGAQSRIPTTTTLSSSSSHLYTHYLPQLTSTSIPSRLSAGPCEGARGHLKWEMPRPCPVCRRIYSNNSNLRRHLRTIHEEFYEKYVKFS